MNNPIRMINRTIDFAKILSVETMKKHGTNVSSLQWLAVLFLQYKLGKYGRVFIKKTENPPYQTGIIEDFAKDGGCPVCMEYVLSVFLEAGILEKIESNGKTIIMEKKS